MFYNTAQFQQYGGYWEETKTKDTQTETEPQQAENLNEKQDINWEGDSHDIVRVTSIPVNTFSPENVGEKEEVENISYPEGGIASLTWLAQVNKVDEATQGAMGQCCDAQPEPSSESSEGPRWKYRDLFDDDDDYSVMSSIFIPLYCPLPPCPPAE